MKNATIRCRRQFHRRFKLLFRGAAHAMSAVSQTLTNVRISSSRVAAGACTRGCPRAVSARRAATGPPSLSSTAVNGDCPLRRAGRRTFDGWSGGGGGGRAPHHERGEVLVLRLADPPGGAHVHRDELRALRVAPEGPLRLRYPLPQRCKLLRDASTDVSTLRALRGPTSGPRNPKAPPAT